MECVKESCSNSTWISLTYSIIFLLFSLSLYSLSLIKIGTQMESSTSSAIVLHQSSNHDELFMQQTLQFSQTLKVWSLLSVSLSLSVSFPNHIFGFWFFDLFFCSFKIHLLSCFCVLLKGFKELAETVILCCWVLRNILWQRRTQRNVTIFFFFSLINILRSKVWIVWEEMNEWCYC